MRVISTAGEGSVILRPRATARAANIELLGLLACSAVILLGLSATYWGTTGRLIVPGPDPLDLRRLRRADDLVPLLKMFEDRDERQAVAGALYRRATADALPVEHVGSLAGVTIPAAAGATARARAGPGADAVGPYSHQASRRGAHGS
jgi:hypothetical protein